MPRPSKAHASHAPADPLIAALIAKLPPPGTPWSEDKQKAWLKLMALALSTTYGGDVASAIELNGSAAPVHVNGSAAPVIEEAPAVAEQPAPAPAPKKKTRSYPFYVDESGCARRKNGARILPSDVGDILYDLRGEAGDPTGIVWADGSVGDGGGGFAISVVT